MKFGVKHSIRTRAILLVVTLLTVSLYTMFYISITSMNRAIESQKQEAVDSIAKSIAYVSELPMAADNSEELDRIVTAFAGEKDIYYIILRDEKGLPKAQYSNESAQRKQYNHSMIVGRSPLVEDNQMILSQNIMKGYADIVVSQSTAELNLFESLGPASKVQKSQVLGRVEVGVSNEPLRKAQRAQELLMLVGLLFAILTSSVLVFLGVSALVRRLDRLVAASWYISHGNLSKPIADSGEDEIARLSEAFESMRKSLNRRQQELKQLNETLKLQVKERTLELEMEKDKVEADSQVKSEYLMSVSQEMRTPLNNLLTAADLLKSEGSNGSQKKYADMVHKAAENLQTMISSMWDLARMEAGKLQLEIEPFDLLDMTEQVVALLSHEASKKQNLLLVDYSPLTPRKIRADKGRIRQVLLNLTENAVRYTEKGSVRIYVWSNEISHNQALFSIEVHDTGAGMTREQINSVFSRLPQFSAAEASYPESVSLNVCKQLIELMGGKIHIDSTPGEGSIFRIEILMAVEAEAGAKQDSRRLLSNKHVLAISNNGKLRGFLHRVMEEWGARLVSMYSSRRALVELRSVGKGSDAYHCIVIDELNDMELEMFIDRVRNKLKLADIPIIMLAGSDNDELVQKYLLMGCSEVFVQPFSGQRLAQVILQFTTP